MASNDPRQNPNTPPSIPLQNLSRPPDGSSQRRSARNLLGSRAYSRLPDAAAPTAFQTPSAFVTTPSGQHTSPYAHNDLGPESPTFDAGVFQEAMGGMGGFAGLSFQGENPSTPAGLAPTRAPLQARVSDYPDETDSHRNHDPYDSADDLTPLTSPRHLHPPSALSNTAGQRNDRDSSQSVRFSISNLDGSPQGSRLGDDLPVSGSGRPRSRTSGASPRSLSPNASPLYRAGSMVRKISQRVVNLSNEPEIVEQSIRRKSSLRQARLEGPPEIPAMEEYAFDAAARKPRPVEKITPMTKRGYDNREYLRQFNPLKGNAIGIFPPDNWLRIRLCDFLVHPATEPLILFLILIQTILLAVDSAKSVYNDPRSLAWGGSWIDYVLLVIFIVYTAEIFVRVIVSGFIINPLDFTTIDRSKGYWHALSETMLNLFIPHRQQIDKKPFALNQLEPTAPNQSIIRSFTALQANVNIPGNTRQQQRVRLARRAYLRHSFNRIDFLAVICFWIAFALALVKLESERHIYIFRMLSCMRILRLLSLTSGTSVILRSLKKAAPLLVNVAFLIGFFWLLFAIVGVQSFKSSFRRRCVWQDPEKLQGNYTNPLGFCGGHLDSTSGAMLPWVFENGQNGTTSHKGYLCPRDSFCVEQRTNLTQSGFFNGTVNFDNIFQSLQLIFVIMSSNTFSDLMYHMTATDYLLAALFFAAGIVIMSLWLMNLLVAVITSSFQVIREESKTSAFTADLADVTEEEEIEEEPLLAPPPSKLAKIYQKTSTVWVVLILYDIIVQGLRSSSMSASRRHFIDNSETAVTLLLLLEIVVRFATDWRQFFKSKRNIVDLGLAIITSVIQLPPIRNSGQPYAWLTFFQILRVYRIVLALTLTRDLIMVVLGNVTGLLNLIIFVFLITFLTAIFAVQIFRGEIPRVNADGDEIRVTFFTIYNAFLGMYQILSSENWTSIMYNVTSYRVGWSTAWAGAAFFVLWFILANFIVLNMFIAVIQESFDVSEDEKRLQQVKAFLQRKEVSSGSQSNLSLSSILKLGSNRRKKDPLTHAASGLAPVELLLKEAVVKDFLDDQEQLLPKTATSETPPENEFTQREVNGGVLSQMWAKFRGIFVSKEPNPFYSSIQASSALSDIDPRTMAKSVLTAHKAQKTAQVAYLDAHPKYNVSLFMFKPQNKIRRFCQRIVGPGRGDRRAEGPEPVQIVWYCFSAFIYAAIVAMVLLACITTPLYQREYFQRREFSIRNWFVYTDMSFAVLFTIEALIKVIADGFFWTPNAYFRGTWGFIDGIVLLTLWVNVATQFYNEGAVSRAVGAFKALRALRLLNVSDSARDTFHSVIVQGGFKVLSAAFVSLSLLIPFAIYGLNIFNGQMLSCNDTQGVMSNLTDCVGEYASKPSNWPVLAPRVVSNPYYDFDNFANSLFILFQIVSQEGWTDVMWSAQSIVGRGMQPQSFTSQGNAVFFVIFNLLGSVFVLTLFVSVFMRNYTEQTGVAFLTADQRAWLEMRKLLRQISPSKRPWTNPDEKWKNWCFRQATRKHGRWQRFVTTVLCLHLGLLLVEFYPSKPAWDRARDYIFLALTAFYIVNIAVRIVGLTWSRFRKSSWDLYSMVAVTGTFITTVLLLSNFKESIYDRLHKLFLVSIALLLIPRNNQLDQLFKTAAASLSAIGNLLATWFVLFLVFAIALTQTFGLTRFGDNENGNLNFRTVPKALILLFRMSCGEGWNAIMEDFANIGEPNCVSSSKFFDSDCGSATWARALFILWNILSMYIFVSLFVSLIFESFSYVYQRSAGLNIVTREEIRKFKHAWSVHDPDGTGFISEQDFPRLLGELTGVFGMRIYEGEHTVGSILEDCSEKMAYGTRQSLTTHPFSRFVECQSKHGERVRINLSQLSTRLSSINPHEIRRRRDRLNTFCEEVYVSRDRERGIPFTNVLLIFAHYNVITDSKSLRLEEFLNRRASLQLVEEEVSRSKVRGFFNMVYWYRQFRNPSARVTEPPSFPNVPEIFVDDQDADQDSTRIHSSSPPLHHPQPSTPYRRSMAHSPDDSPPSPLSDPRSSPNPFSTTYTPSPSAPHSPQLSPFRPSFDASPSPTPHHGPSHSTSSAQHSGWAFLASQTPGNNLSTIPSHHAPSHHAPSHHAPSHSGSSNAALGVGGVGGASVSGRSADHSRQNSAVSAQDVLEVLESSAWGESIRRSFTVRRGGSSAGASGGAGGAGGSQGGSGRPSNG
ncbi:MAG: calcium channel protein [Vezdaea aestivalis]|nr:MAG: calcium channel protein [Vezdaea aestivalis]